MTRTIQSRIQQRSRTSRDATKEKRKHESTEDAQVRLESARHYKQARRSLQDRIEQLEARASENRVSEMAATLQRNEATQSLTACAMKCDSDESRFFAEIDKPLTKVCAVCGERVAPDSVKTLLYSARDPRFKLLSVVTPTGSERGLVPAGIVRDGSKEMVSICSRCGEALKRKQKPRFSAASGFRLTPMPDCLIQLNPMEARMIGIGVCFTTCYTLGALGQSATRGNSINFWNSAYDIVSKLPRPASRCGVIRLQKQGSSDCSPYYNVRPWLLREALSWLIAHNPIYRDVHIDYELLDTMPSEPNVPAVDFEEDEIETDTGHDSEHNTNRTPDERYFDESFVLEHANETQSETDIMLELLQGRQEEQAYVSTRPDRPMNEYTTRLLMQTCFPTLFPHGLGGFHPIEGVEHRDHEFKLAEYCSHLMAWHDRRFVTHPTFKFFCLNLIQRRQIDGLLKQVHRTAEVSPDVDDTTGEVNSAQQETEPAGDVNDARQETGPPRHNVSKYLKDLRPFFRSVRGTGLYWANVRDDVMSMLGNPALENPWPTFFVTLSAADTVWPDFFRVCDPALSWAQAAALSPAQRRKFLNENPDLAARHFHRRFKAFFQHILCGKSKPLGAIVDYFWRIEFQRRGSPHVHALFWVKDAPDILQLSQSRDGAARLAEFADRFVSCWRGHNRDGTTTPTDPLAKRPPSFQKTQERGDDLAAVVERVQVHACSTRSSCQRNGMCRFGFPKPLRDDTEIVRDVEKGAVRIRFEHKRDDPHVNNYNPSMLSAWRANMDVKIIGNAYGAAEYTAAYISKAEPDSVRFRKTIEKALTKLPTGVPYERVLKRTANAVLAIREVSAQEAVYILSSTLCLYEKSRTVLKVKVSRHDRRYYRLDTKRCDTARPNDGLRIEAIENAYMLRPHSGAFDDLTYREFCEAYEISPTKPNGRERLLRSLLLDGKSYIKTRSQRQVVRPSPRYRTDEEDANYCYAELLLHKPWRHLSDIPLDDADVCAEYLQWKTSSQWSQHINNRIHREEMLELSQNQAIILPAPNWSFVLDSASDAVPTESQIEDPDHFQQYTPKRTYTPADISRARTFLKDVVKPFAKRDMTTRTCTTDPLPILYPTDDQFPRMTDDQWKPFSIWMDQSRRRLNSTRAFPCTPVQMVVSGEGGTGKSWLIRQIIQDLRVVYGREDASARVLLMAHQGSAAYLIGGRTLTSALALPCQGRNIFRRDYEKLSTTPGGQTKLQRLQEEHDRVQLVVIDEFGVVSCGMLHWIDQRLREIFVDDSPFGGRDVLFTGDPNQLGPVVPSDLSTQLDDLVYDSETKGRTLWEAIDLYFVLREQNRGSDDPGWYATLRRLRDGSAQQHDLQLINSRLQAPPAARAGDLVYLAYRNIDVDRANEDALRTLARPMCRLRARHDVQLRPSCSATCELDDSTRRALLQEAKEITTPTSSFLPLQLDVCEGAPVVLTYNMEQRAGLCNGSKGEIYDIIPDDGTFTHQPIVLVKMRDYHGPSFFADVPQIIPVSSRTVPLNASKDGPYRLSRTALPLHLGFATTIHKIQGQTCSGVVLNPTRLSSSALAYVALSRVRKRTDMFISKPMTLEQLDKTDRQRRTDDAERARITDVETRSCAQISALVSRMKTIAMTHNFVSIN